jgi:hypothetical protein
MSEPQDLPPTAHQDEESATPAVGVDSQGSPAVEVVDESVPRLAGKRADEDTAHMTMQDPPLHDS